MTIRMLTITSLALLSAVALTAPAHAQEITCEMVRSYVAQVGFQQAAAVARANGITAEQERMARACLGQNTSRAHKEVRVTQIRVSSVSKRSYVAHDRHPSGLPAGAVF